jgi:hypothetical protein
MTSSAAGQFTWRCAAAMFARSRWESGISMLLKLLEPLSIGTPKFTAFLFMLMGGSYVR